MNQLALYLGMFFMRFAKVLAYCNSGILCNEIKVPEHLLK